MAVPYYALLITGAIYLRLMVGRFEPAAASADVRPEREPWSGAELRTLAVLAVTSMLWLTDHLHHLSPAIPALLGAALLLLPGIGVLSWKTFEARLSWSLILTVGTSLSLATLMTQSGAAAWLGQHFLGPISGLAATPHILVVCLIVAAALIHLAITNLAACVALLLPINATLAESAGLNPLVTGLIITMVVDAVILYPVQTASNLMALTILIALLVLPYWSLLGVPLSAR
jgi:sodium-dependent dicarboxylate transporter 2/3/5